MGPSGAKGAVPLPAVPTAPRTDVHLARISQPASAGPQDSKDSASSLEAAKTAARSLSVRDPGVRSARLDSLYDGTAADGSRPIEVPGAAAQGRSAAALAPGPVAEAAVSIESFSLPTPVHAIARSKTARQALLATGIFKFGMEALNVSMPLVALTYFGSAVWMATMAAAWGASMTLGSSIGGGLVDRKPVQKVLAGAMAAQFVLVSAMIGVMLAGVTTPLALLPLYAASGATMGVILTARDTIPSRILGRKHSVLSAFNATTHLSYEVAGTLAPLLVGLLVQRFGLVAGLFIHPPAYLLAAIIFYRLKLDPAKAPRVSESTQTAQTPRRGLRGILSDVRKGAKVILGTSEFRWLGFMLLLPMVIHRVVDQMFIPFFATAVLGAAQRSAWMISASNFGELAGAVLLLRTLMDPEARKPTPYRWGKLMAAGLLAVWGFAVTGSLFAVLPMIFAMSMTWAANDLNMTAYFQSRLPAESAGKAVGFLMALELATIMAASYLLGFVFDYAPAGWAFPILAAVVTLLAGAFLKGRARVKADYLKSHPAPAPAPAATLVQ